MGLLADPHEDAASGTSVLKRHVPRRYSRPKIQPKKPHRASGHHCQAFKTQNQISQDTDMVLNSGLDKVSRTPISLKGSLGPIN